MSNLPSWIQERRKAASAKSEINSEYRRFADGIAKYVAPMLPRAFGWAPINPPKCRQITRRRGHSAGHGSFSVPQWIFERHPAYRLYYIVHEVCHNVPGPAQHHGPAFRLNETRLMEHFGYRLCHAERGPYLREIRDLATGWSVCDKFGRVF